VSDDDVTATSSSKEAAIARLRAWQAEIELRDPLVCAAKRAGCTYTEIMNASGLAKRTVNSILDRAGLTGPQPTASEAPVTTATAPRFFPHHPHFIKVETVTQFGSTGDYYTFKAFTGTEPEPTHPDFPGSHKSVEEQTDDEKAMWAEFSERNREIDAAIKCWQEARYFRGVTPLVKAACKARQPVDEALAAMETAWTDLDNALVWPVAVKQVLDAHKNATDAMNRWVNDFAEPLAMFEGKQPFYVREHIADWRGVAEKLGYKPQWDVGSYWAGDAHTHASYDDSPLAELQRTIREQRAQLDEIAKFIKQDGRDD
jgi:hypothetical protein